MGFQVMMALSFLVAGDRTKDPAKRDLERLLGTWLLVGGEDKGQPFGEEEARGEKESVIFSGDNMTLVQGQGRDTWAVRLDPGKNPAWIDLIYPGGQKVNHAIYRLDGDRLTVCVSRKHNPNSSEERPARFTTRRANNKNLGGLYLSIYQRQKK
jgi:uncharacterized protein (TIGR03067 family)